MNLILKPRYTRTALLLLAFMLSSVALFAGNTYKLPAQAGQPVEMFWKDGKPCLVTTTGVFVQEKSVWNKVISAPAEVRGALLRGDSIYLATATGLFAYAGFGAAPVPSFQGKSIKGCVADATGNLWVATEFDGVWARENSGAFRQRLQVPVVNCIRATGDSAVWAGTDLGLYKLNPSGGVTRYAEEGYSGYELPDNIVEQLFADAASNVWVVMPSNLSYKPAVGDGGEIPTYDFIGSAGNKVLAVLEAGAAGYVFVTANGMYSVARSHLQGHDHGGEVHATPEPTHAIRILPEDIGAPRSAGSMTSAFSVRGRLYFFGGQSACWSVSAKELRKKLRGRDRMMGAGHGTLSSR